MQSLIAANPQAMQGGKFTVTSANSLTIPPDMENALAASGPSNTTSAGAGASPSASGSGVPAAGAASSAAPSTTPSNGAASVASSSVVVGLVAVVATFLAL